MPAGKLINAVADSDATHKHRKVRAWLGRHPRWTFHLHPPPPRGSMPSRGFFAIFTKRRLKPGVPLHRRTVGRDQSLPR